MNLQEVPTQEKSELTKIIESFENEIWELKGKTDKIYFSSDKILNIQKETEPKTNDIESKDILGLFWHYIELLKQVNHKQEVIANHLQKISR